MTAYWRLVSLALGLVRQSLGRYVMIVGLLTTCVLVFLAVQAISAASADNLDESVDADLGQAGSYRIDVQSGLGIPQADVDTLVNEALSGATVHQIVRAARFTDVAWRCTDDGEATGQALYVILEDFDGGPRQITGDQPDGFACLGGLDVSTQAELATGRDEQFLDRALLIDPALTDIAQALSPYPLATSYLVVTGSGADDSIVLNRMVSQALDEPAQRAGVDLRQLITVTKIDESGQIRDAASSVRLVYGIVAWAILLVGGVGLLLVEMSNIRERSWLFGLARAVGARRSDVALLVFLDAALVVLAGAVLTAITGTLLQPLVEAFGQDNFNVALTLLDPAVMPQLLLGIVTVLFVGAAVPARRAAASDPVDVLEGR